MFKSVKCLDSKTPLNGGPGSEAEVLPAGRVQGEGGDGVDMPHTSAEDCQAGGRQVGMPLPMSVYTGNRL